MISYHVKIKIANNMQKKIIILIIQIYKYGKYI